MDVLRLRRLPGARRRLLLGAKTLVAATWLTHRRERHALSFSLLTLSILAVAMGSVLLMAGGGIVSRWAVPGAPAHHP